MTTATKKIQPGYKQTEVGVIPEDWEVIELKDAVDFLDGQRRPIKNSERAKMRGQYPYYGASGIIDYVNDFLFDDELILLGEDGENILSRNLPLAFVVKGKVWVNNHAHVLKSKEAFDTYFLAEKLESLNYENHNTGTAQPKLNKKNCSKIRLSLPPTKSEQTAIATALSDMDALIAAQEQLIAKKRAIKQGAMQELLEKKEGWEEIKLGQIGRFSSSSVDKIYRENDYEVFLLNYMDVYRNKVITPTKIPSRTTANTTQLKNHDLRKGDVLFTPTSETPDDIGHSALILHDLSETVFSYHLMRLRFNDNKLLDEFKPYILNSQSLSQYFFEKATGSTRYVLKKSDFENAPITIPSTIKEQTRIAQILSDMDAEIEQLGKELAKYRDMKKGMMEELLTGRKRLTF